MTELKPFQQATVEAVLKAFRGGVRTKRFLVADEVGLGKTVVAQHVIRSLMKGRRRPLVVYYLCSNLAIARQNRRKLLEVLPVDERQDADCPVDRLSLLPGGERPRHRRLNLYSLTPDTSLPIRRRHRRDGRQEERALVHALVERAWPGLFRDFGRDVFRRGATARWRELVRRHEGRASNVALREAFARSARREFGARPGQHLLPLLSRLYDQRSLDDLGLISHFRNALAASAVEEDPPDLVIFDEFQRFRDLLEPQRDAAAQRVIGQLRGDGASAPPALLLLSATPYRLFTRRWEEEAGASHRTEFFELIEFLYGGDDRARGHRDACERAFGRLEGELRKGQPDSETARAARGEVERLLRPIIARTERASHPNGWDDFHTQPLAAPLAGDDVRVFKHLSASFAPAHRPSAVSYWTSIPMPMQTMGRHYVAWKSAAPAPAHGTPQVSESMRDRLRKPRSWPHPRLRALQRLSPTERLAVPWLPPTAAWWPLQGAWRDGRTDVGSAKVLVFSRFRAVPQAIAAALSYDLEASLLRGERTRYGDASHRRLLSAAGKRHSLLGLFHPSPLLIAATDPLAAKTRDLKLVKRHVRRQVREMLARLKVGVSETAPFLRYWRVVARLERRAGNWDWVRRGWESTNDSLRAGAEGDAGLGQLLSEWDRDAAEPIDKIKPAMVDMIVEYALGAPGVVLGRSLSRHWPEAASEGGFEHTLGAAWMGLRTYLDQPWFHRTLRRRGETYPEALLRAVVDGNLESVLDEHLWITAKLRSLGAGKLAEELRDGLTLKNGVFFLHPLSSKGDKPFSLRCHAAMPFVQSRAGELEGDEQPVRTDDLRRSFNSPFWPYVLATTSVGQEGLDFHAWCDTLVHWDLCRNPADLEQREGRIQRFGGLAVRRAVARAVGAAAMRERVAGESPWSRIEALADRDMRDPSGLAPWWVCKDGAVQRHVFDVPTSEQRHWLQWMKEQRLLYRLALGQPNQEDLMEVLSSNGGVRVGTVREAVVNLSPWFGSPRTTSRE